MVDFMKVLAFFVGVARFMTIWSMALRGVINPGKALSRKRK